MPPSIIKYQQLVGIFVDIGLQGKADTNKTALALEECAMLSDVQIRKIKPTDKPQKLSDSGGLFLLVTPQGGKFWRLAYRLAGKQKTLSIGEYPYISMAEARNKREEAKRQLANGIDPSAAKIAAKTASQGMAANSFEIIGREWHKTHMASKSEGHAQKTIDRLEKDVFPWLGKTPITDIEAPDIEGVQEA